MLRLGSSSARGWATNERALTYTITETAELLGIGRAAAYEAARTGQLPTIRLGRRLLVPRFRLGQLLGYESNEAAIGNGDLVKTSDAGGGRGED